MTTMIKAEKGRYVILLIGTEERCIIDVMPVVGFNIHNTYYIGLKGLEYISIKSNDFLVHDFSIDRGLPDFKFEDEIFKAEFRKYRSFYENNLHSLISTQLNKIQESIEAIE